MKGFFISLEGPEGSGKTLQASRLEKYFAEKGQQAVLIREPGGTSIGEQIRDIIISIENSAMLPVSEALLYAASRAQIVGQVIIPALDSGKIVVCDRFIDSSIAYQGFARGLDIDKLYSINRFAASGIMPDITIFLDLSPEAGLLRKKADKEFDRLEAESLDFHKKVYEGYKHLAENDSRIVTINAEESSDIVFENIIFAINKVLAF